MTTSSITHRRSIYAAAATGLVGTLMAATLNSAYAMPDRDDHPSGPAITVHTHSHRIAHSCFITPHTWKEALAGPLPRCYTWVP